MVAEMAEMFESVLHKSPQAIYLYLDDEHKVCNAKFAKLLGYKNPQEWTDNMYPVDDVAKEDQDKGIKAYMDASQKLQASSFDARWVRKDGKKIKTNVVMVPIPYKDEVFVLHFITPIK